MPTRSRRYHTVKLLLLVVLAWFTGWMAGYPLMSLLIAAAVYAGWHIVNLWRLRRWVLKPESEVPESLGLWSDIFDGINSITKNNRNRQHGYQARIHELTSLIEALPDAMLLVDRDGIITWGNSVTGKLLGMRIPEDLGKPVSSLLRDPDFTGWLATQADRKSALDLPSPRGGGLWLTASAVPLPEHQQLIILRNITGTHNVEQIRRDFVANISHELRTPLTVIRGYLEMLHDHPSDEVSELVTKMLGPAVQMQTLLDDLLELSRLQREELRGKDEVVNVPAMLQHLREQAEGLSRGDHQIIFEVDSQLWLEGIASDLESAFSNLIANAVKYTPKRGSITVTWTQGTQGPQLLVRDTGIGIPPRDVPRVTERFYRVGSDRARETGGTGLGLAIVKHVLNAHQAQLTITSELGVGSAFACTFPAERARDGNTSPLNSR
jgi:two-component system phosphate regulon sensor histidine kinase PhoR